MLKLRVFLSVSNVRNRKLYGVFHKRISSVRMPSCLINVPPRRPLQEVFPPVYAAFLQQNAFNYDHENSGYRGVQFVVAGGTSRCCYYFMMSPVTKRQVA